MEIAAEKVLSKPGAKTLIRVARQHGEHVEVILKSMQRGDARVSQLRNEYKILQRVDRALVRKALDLKRVDGRMTILLEYIRGVDVLEAFEAGPKGIEEFLVLAIKMAEALAQVHLSGIVHRDINPRNMILAADTGLVYVIDFGISRRIGSKVSHQGSASNLEGTLAYLSPEQTGRMNRRVDFRSDLYSLGVTFYQLLTGQLPFTDEDDLSLVHAHLARRPERIDKLDRTVPEMICKIVEKLMSKGGHERYQSTGGLLKDLQLCLQMWRKEGSIEHFTLGSKDQGGTLIFPENLYGRDRELSLMRGIFSEVKKGSTALFMVGGYSGVGKTVLVNELHRPVAEANGVFLQGKYGQYQRSIPYFAIKEALAGLQDIWNTFAPEERESLKEQLQMQLQMDVAALLEFMPDLQDITGPLPALPPLDAQDAVIRLQQAFRGLVHVLTAKAPIVIFLDDMQWADTASLSLIKQVILDSTNSRVLLIGAYRNNEVSAGHGLQVMIDEIEDKGGNLHKLALQSLLEGDVLHYLKDCFQWSSEQARELNTILFSKTKGNAFFVKEFIKAIYDKAHIVYDQELSGWIADTKAIGLEQVSENVVDLVAHRMDRLEERPQQVLMMAACLGNVFSLRDLADVAGSDQASVFRVLWSAVESELVYLQDPTHELLHGHEDEAAIHESVSYRFSHDRIQQAAYQMRGEEQSLQAHVSIGKYLYSRREASDNLFDMLQHLNLAHSHGVDAVDIADLTQLNLEAARTAVESAAFDSAKAYITRAQELSKGSDSPLVDDIDRLAAEIYFLNGDLDRAEAQVRHCLQRTEDVQAKADLYYLLMLRQALSSQNEEAIDTARMGLALLDFELPSDDLESHIATHMGWLMSNFQEHGIAPIFDSDELKDPNKVAIIKILDNISMPSYVSGKVHLWILHVLLKVRLSIEHGIRPESGYAFSELALILCINNLFEPAFASADLAQRLGAHFAGTSLRHQGRSLHLIANYISPWRIHYRETAAINNESHQINQASGETIFIGYTVFHPFYNQFYVGERSLKDLHERLPQAISFSQTIKHDLAYNSLRGMLMMVENLMDQTGTETTFSSEGLSEEEFLASCIKGLDYYSVCIWYVFKAKILLLYGFYDEARDALKQTADTAAALSGHAAGLTTLNFTQSLLLLQSIEAGSGAEDEVLSQIAANQELMKIWADSCPDNFEHKYLLVEAMRRATLGDRDLDTLDLFQKAIDSAATYGYAVEEAIAHEQLAQYLTRHGQSHYAKYHVRQAIEIFSGWGATRVVRCLEERHQFSLARYKASYDRRQSAITKQTTILDLDFQSMLKASEAFSAELELAKLQSTLVDIVMENAGAQRAALILGDTHAWRLEELASIQQEKIEHHVVDDHRDNIPTSVINYVLQTRDAVVLGHAALDPRFMHDQYIKENESKSIMSLPIINTGRILGVVLLENDLTTEAFTPNLVETLRILTAQMGNSIHNAQLYENLSALNQAYARFLPMEFLDTLNYQSIVDIKLGDQVARNMTVLFSDIRDYTTLSEGMSPKENFDFINAYLRRISPHIEKHEGFINQFYGDGMMAIFPRPEQAVAAAVGMHKSLNDYNVERSTKGRVELRMGVGVHTGNLMLGVIGDEDRHDVTVISDVVNGASRIEGLTKTFGVGIAISEEALSSMQEPDRFKRRLLGKLQVKGKNQIFTTYEIFDGEVPDQIRKRESTQELFAEALKQYFSKNFAEAAVNLRRILDENPSDQVCAYYIKRAAQYLVSGVDDTWTGVETMQNK